MAKPATTAALAEILRQLQELRADMRRVEATLRLLAGAPVVIGQVPNYFVGQPLPVTPPTQTPWVEQPPNPHLPTGVNIS